MEVMKTKKQVKDGFYKVQTIDDWGYVAFLLWAKYSDAGTVSVNDQDDLARIHEGDKLDVLWPDGSVSREKVESRPGESTYTEQGQYWPRTVSYPDLYVTVSQRGLKTKVPLAGLWVRRPA